MAFHFERLHVLVVEDTEPLCKLVVSVLDTLGVGVDVAEDGQQGFVKFCRENPDIVITDWHMTPVSGIDLVSQIRTDARSPNKMVPVIIMTGFNATQRVGFARDAGVTEYLVKPFSAGDLAKRIAHVIKNPRDFVLAPDFVGPDRRRRRDPDYKGPLRRFDDT